MNLQSMIFFAGIGQLAIVVGSLAIPQVLRWSKDVAQLRPLTRQVFWTYAAYIWSTNLFFGLISVAMPAELVAEGRLPLAVTLFIAIYWAARVGIQFCYFDRSDAPQGFLFVIAEWTLVALFVAMTLIYGYAAWVNAGGAPL